MSLFDLTHLQKYIFIILKKLFILNQSPKPNSYYEILGSRQQQQQQWLVNKFKTFKYTSSYSLFAHLDFKLQLFPDIIDSLATSQI